MCHEDLENLIAVGLSKPSVLERLDYSVLVAGNHQKKRKDCQRIKS